MAREPTQDQGQKSQKRMGSNPGTFSPDDDEAQEADRSSIDDKPQSQAQQGQMRQAQDDRRRRPEENIEQVEDEEAEDDEDGSDIERT